MALVSFPGDGLWIPDIPQGIQSDRNNISPTDATMTTDLQEIQIIGSLKLSNGSSATFGTSGSSISWLPGASITFTTGATLRVGVKKASSLDLANGPVGRATTGLASFDVYDDLVGGTDSISSTTYRTDAMSAGTPFTVTSGDNIAVCFCLTPAGGSPSVKIRSCGITNLKLFPFISLFTSPSTYTVQPVMPNIGLTFDDGTTGWIQSSLLFSVPDTISGTIGNTNIFANIFNLPYTWECDAICATALMSSSAANTAFDIYSTPLGTPSLLTSVAIDANLTGSSNTSRMLIAQLSSPQTLQANTDYAIGLRQTTATACNTWYRSVGTSTDFRATSLNGTNCYAANSTAGATFTDALATKLRRYHIWAHISAIDIPAGGGSTPHIIGG